MPTFSALACDRRDASLPTNPFNCWASRSEVFLLTIRVLMGSYAWAQQGGLLGNFWPPFVPSIIFRPNQTDPVRFSRRNEHLVSGRRIRVFAQEAIENV